MTTTLSAARPGLRWLASGLAIGLLAAALVAPAMAQAQTDSDDGDIVPSISVSGVGRVKAEPDVADINLGVTKQGDDAKQASQKAAQAMEAVIAALLAGRRRRVRHPDHLHQPEPGLRLGQRPADDRGLGGQSTSST